MIPTKLNQNLMVLAECLLKFMAEECCCNNCGSSPLQPPHNTQPPTYRHNDYQAMMFLHDFSHSLDKVYMYYWHLTFISIILTINEYFKSFINPSLNDYVRGVRYRQSFVHLLSISYIFVVSNYRIFGFSAS